MISIASWSPRKSEPLTVSNACDSHESSGLSAALMPPCAAFECERTGWTFARMPTDTPSSAAASAARCPARPAPITSTSWEGILVAGLLAGGPAAADCMAGRLWECASPRGAALTSRSGQPRGGLQRPRDLLDRHDAAQHAVGVDRHDRAQPREGLRAEQRLERLVHTHPERRPRVGRHHLAHVRAGPQRLGHVLEPLARG